MLDEVTVLLTCLRSAPLRLLQLLQSPVSEFLTSVDKADVLLSMCLIGRPSGSIYICLRAAHWARYSCYSLQPCLASAHLGRPVGMTNSTNQTMTSPPLLDRLAGNGAWTW